MLRMKQSDGFRVGRGRIGLPLVPRVLSLFAARCSLLAVAGYLGKACRCR
jgi:hypothetical protein